MNLETNRSLEGELRFCVLILNMLSEGTRDVQCQENSAPEGFISLMKAGIFIECKVLWVTKMVTYGKYEVPFVLENYEDHLIRSNVAPMQVLHSFLCGNYSSIYRTSLSRYNNFLMLKRECVWRTPACTESRDLGLCGCIAGWITSVLCSAATTGLRK